VVKDVVQDPVTGTLVFYSTCNALGTTPYGAQIYAMRPDGSALRQLTDTAGYVVAPDGAISAELPGPTAYSAPARF
jgi:Tol biopolymer transport system component